MDDAQAVAYSFVIITDLREPDKLQAEIDSIKVLNIPSYEILVVKDVDKSGKLGKLRNSGCRQAKGDVLIVADDDLVFHDDFYSGLVEYGDDFDVLSCKLLNPDGTRYWDWKVYKDGKNALIPYDETSPDVSLTGGLTIMKADVFKQVQWDERRGFYQEEDVDFSNRLKQSGIRIAFNPHSTVTHDAPYTFLEGFGVIKNG
jgi:hypothetical protein